jgi:serine protease AprX
VVNLAFGTDGGGDYRTDPLAFAAEVAWRRGVVVVVSAGNGGEESGRLTNPAIDPYVLAVGAAETYGTRSVADDRVAPFSSRGDGTRNPDVVAPGRSIVSARAPGSFVDNNYPAARVGEHLMRGSGSSQAAAVVAGASALLLQQRPELTPDQVKSALVRSARPLPRDPVTAQGAGLINVDAASGKTPSALQQAWEPARGVGSLETSRGTSRAHVGGERIEGERDAWGRDFDSNGWASSSWSGSSWSGSSWSGSSWSGSSWSGSSWSGSSWTGSSWSGSSWTATDWG